MSLTADDGGRFTHTAVVPEDAAPGWYEMTARCTAMDTGGARAAFEVVGAPRPDPRLSLPADSGPPGTRLTVTGTGFRCAEGAALDVGPGLLTGPAVVRGPL
ncbi:hypothetical protein [Streptomyces sp. NPDC096152]|uniref:hypothetical protein n=1 Tax=Streptomyces sp. NPDC096152 TaxID=3366078 RepID=UPI0038142396